MAVESEREVLLACEDPTSSFWRTRASRSWRRSWTRTRRPCGSCWRRSSGSGAVPSPPAGSTPTWQLYEESTKFRGTYSKSVDIFTIICLAPLVGRDHGGVGAVGGRPVEHGGALELLRVQGRF